MTGPAAPGRPRNLGSAFAARAAATPAAPYVSTVDADGELATLTFGQAWLAGLDLAARLAHAHGVRPGGLVAIVPTSGLASVLTMWGGILAGAGVLMLDPAWSPRQRTEIAARYGAVLIEGEVSPDGPAVVSGPPAAVSAGQTALVFNTSGSTGIPKAVALSHSAVLANAHSFRSHHGLDSGTRILTPLPLHHSNAVNTCLISPLVSGGHSVLVPPSSLLDLPRWIARVEPTIISAVPSVLDALLTIWRGGALPASVRYALSAAAPLSRATAEGLFDRLDLRVVQAYGLSETVNFSTTMPVGLEPGRYRALMLDLPVPSVGLAIPDVTLTVCDPDGSPVAPGQVGEVRISGPALMSGYLDSPEATAAVLRDGVFRTGDLGYLRDEPGVGALLYLTGRLKNVAKVRGEQVSCEEVEHILRTMPEVADAGCVIVPDARDGERLVAGVVFRGDGGAEAVAAQLRAGWPERMMPRRIVTVDAVPRTSTGKLRRDELRAVIDGS
ncbi:class I adenylate-forming enzyme family protein [Solwaraspora sp. WMMD1047]|uniref:class I adenylate-forming enzyme family protein n=1 Tax=Solwaraspora sp. WMMD1047 TaxID=3016102 RepID=UPI002417A7FD|nr:class I adenylate-forming enzyme family protein [Solwaraspora sp. WMMD1047]MDG4829595.1 class I adenylate-forming enzyme family protein [Solwaraspora sp. WMMD1047]